MGTTLHLFLIDDKMTGRIKCSIGQRTTVLYKIPRTELDRCNIEDNSDISKHLRQTGIYFLIGKDEESGKEAIYIGQAILRANGGAILTRLQEHKRNPDKDYFSEVIAITTTDNTLGATELNYLENKFTMRAVGANRFVVKNANTPNVGSFSEETESDLNEFIENVELIMGTLGYRPFTPFVSAPAQNSIIDDEIFYYKGNGFDAKCKVTDEGFVLLKDSTVLLNRKGSTGNSTIKARESNESKIDSNGKTQEDILFASASGAACFVVYGSINGKEVWKNANGQTMKDLNI